MDSCEERFLDIDGVRTRVLRGGDGPPLVYWHGAGAADLWFPHHALLAERFTDARSIVDFHHGRDRRGA